jgi:acetyl-CoA carboxylase carboxyl transferase subunit beta
MREIRAGRIIDAPSPLKPIPLQRSEQQRRMSWLEKLLPPKIQQTDPTERRQVPEGPVDQVPELRERALQDRPGAEPERLPQVQPPPPHRRARAAGRLSWTPKAATKSARKCCPVDALKFKDSRKYPERLKEAWKTPARPTRWS